MKADKEIGQSPFDHYRYLLVGDDSKFATVTRDGHWVWVKRPLTDRLLRRSLEGYLPLAISFLRNGQATQGAIDSDQPDGLRDLQRVGRKLREYGLNPLLETSARGGHLRFFHEPLDALVPTLLLRETLAVCGVEAEVFPKSRRGASALRAVYSPHPRTRLQYDLMHLDTLEPVGPVLAYLGSYDRAPAKAVAEALAAAVEEAARARVAATVPRVVSSERQSADDLKRDLDILDIVGRDREVQKIGRHYFALCPFHGDHRPSLVLYPSTQTFHCFGCGRTGDAIRYLALRQGIRDGEVMAQLRKK